MSTIVVTGAAGFIGSHLCDRLLRDRHDVVGVDNFDNFYDPDAKRRNLSAALGHNRFQLVEADIRDAETMSRVVNDDVEMVVHLAARAGVRPSIECPLLYQDVNVLGTTTLLEAARRRRDRRFILASSSSVYGDNTRVPFRESDPVDHPISPYAASKRACELIAHTFHHLYRLPVTALRFFTVYGPRQRPDLAIHKFVRLIERDEPIPMFGDGAASRDFTYVDDIVDGVVAAMERCDGHRIYNLGGSSPVSVSRLIEVLERVTGRSARVHRLADQPGDVRCTYADISLARRELGFHPVVLLPEGLARFVDWYRQDRRQTDRSFAEAESEVAAIS